MRKLFLVRAKCQEYKYPFHIYEGLTNKRAECQSDMNGPPGDTCQSDNK